MFRKIFLSLLLAFSLFFPGWANAQEAPAVQEEEIVEGIITDISSQEALDFAGQPTEQRVFKVDIERGSLAGEEITIFTDPIVSIDVDDYAVGDRVAVLWVENPDGERVFFITGHVRRQGLWILFGGFAFLAILIGRKWGASSLIGMAFSFLVIFKFILPQIMGGMNAVLAAILGSAVIIPVTFSLSHGWKEKTWIASLGTVLALVVTGVLAVIAVELTHLSGFGSEEAQFLQVMADNAINMKGLLLAGMIISSLGILDDITISQASVVAELRAANEKLKAPELFSRAMNVGRDHIASLINTLVLVYAGASLPLMLLFIQGSTPFLDIINTEMIAEEIVRTLVGSTGLVLAVPITTFLATTYYREKS